MFSELSKHSSTTFDSFIFYAEQKKVRFTSFKETDAQQSKRITSYREVPGKFQAIVCLALKLALIRTIRPLPASQLQSVESSRCPRGQAASSDMQALLKANSQSKQAQGLDENKKDISYQTTFLKPMLTEYK